jgi:cytochrome P450
VAGRPAARGTGAVASAARLPIPADLDDALLSPQYLVDPYPIYERLRGEAPIGWSRAFNSWILTRYDDDLWALREPHLGTSGRMTAFLAQLPEDERRRAGIIEAHFERTLPFLGPPRHTKVKALVQKAFTARVVESLRPGVLAYVDRFLDGVGGGRMDVMTELANPLPINVIGMMLGVPEADRGLFRPWTERVFAIFSSGTAVPETVTAGRQSLEEMRAYLAALIDERRRASRDDLISRLVGVSEAGEMLSDEDVLANCVTLYTAGHETTSGLIGNGILALLRHPEQLEALRRRPELAETAVDELLRYDTSLQRTWRIATSDVERGGHVIRAGELLSTMLGAANRDPEKFEHPDLLDIERKPNRHLGFGQGMHFCVGAMLAGMEVAVALNRLLARFRELDVVEEGIVWGPDRTFRSMRSLPIRVG